MQRWARESIISAEMAARQRTVEWTLTSRRGRSEPSRRRDPGSLSRLRRLGRRPGLGAAAPELLLRQQVLPVAFREQGSLEKIRLLSATTTDLGFGCWVLS